MKLNINTDMGKGTFLVANPDNELAVELVNYLNGSGKKPSAFKYRSGPTLHIVCASLLVAWAVFLFVVHNPFIAFGCAIAIIYYSKSYKARKKAALRQEAQDAYDELCESGDILKVPGSLKVEWEQVCRLQGYKRGITEWGVVEQEYFPAIRNILLLELPSAQRDLRLHRDNRTGIDTVIHGWFNEIIQDIQLRREAIEAAAKTGRQIDATAFNAGVEKLLGITPPSHGITPPYRPYIQNGE